MLEFTRTFNDVVVRMKQDAKGNIYFSAYDVSLALGLKDRRRAVNSVVIEEKGSFLDQLNWGSELILFISNEYVIGLTLKAEQDITKSFLKWLMEVSDVSKRFRHPQEFNSIRDESGAYYATTQIAKKYGMSARSLNSILEKNGVQHKVNNQWVLYSKYQAKGFEKIIRIPKTGSENEFVLHTYWTETGAKFVESLLEKAGYSQKGSQLSLF